MPHSEQDYEHSMMEDYGHRLLPQIVDYQAKHAPEKLAVAIAKSSDISKGYRETNYKELANAVNYMAWWLEGKFGGKGNFETIAYLGVQDHRYTIFELAAIKTGYVVSVFLSLEIVMAWRLTRIARHYCLHTGTVLHTFNLSSRKPKWIACCSRKSTPNSQPACKPIDRVSLLSRCQNSRIWYKRNPNTIHTRRHGKRPRMSPS